MNSVISAMNTARKEYADAKWHNLKPCVLCLYRSGLGVKRIAKLLRIVSPSWIFLRLRDEGEIDPSRKSQTKPGETTWAEKLKARKDAKAIYLASNQFKIDQQNKIEGRRIRNRLAVRESNARLSPERRRIRNAKTHHHRMKTPVLRLAFYCRKRIRTVLKQRGIYKRTRTLKYIGCSAQQARAHIESQFEPGMTWDNHGKIWHIDHILPLALYDLTSEEQQMSAFNISNLRPLWASDNLRKSDSLTVEWDGFTE